MTILRTLIEKSISNVLTEHPNYLTPRGQRYLHNALLRRITTSLRESLSEQASEESSDVSPSSAFRLCAPDSRDAIGYNYLRSVAGAGAGLATSGGVSIPSRISADVLDLFADAAEVNQAGFISDSRQCAAWREFFARMLGGAARRPITIERSGERGILVPWRWPPRRDGTLSGQDEERVAS